METQFLSFQQQSGIGIIEFKAQPQDSLEYISLNRAMNEKKLEVSEIDEEGSINDILVINKSDHYIFGSDGDILIGAKQNRILNTSIFLPPKANITIPVSCVESGRWRYEEKGFSPSDHVAPSALRKEKGIQVHFSLNMDKRAYADQGAVWNKVGDYEAMHNHQSVTSDFTETFKKKEKDFDKSFSKLKANKQANGMALFLDGELTSIELFNRQDVYKEYFQKLLKGMILDLYVVPNKRVLQEEALYLKVMKVLSSLKRRKKEVFPAVGSGEEIRFRSKQLSGMMLKFDETLVHCSIHIN